jgi:hypothetical protein
MPLEILDVALVPECRPSGGKSAEIATLAGARIFLARVEAEPAVSEFADHR